ncbi:LeuA Isopropylmalate/homocitrate/citramalate synthases [Fimbriimonadaceae bacterium]
MRIVEVGPRDGLQNESVPISTAVKLDFIAALANAGIHEIEATSFVSPKWVPQLADAAELWPQLPAGPKYSALVPNVRGMLRAVEVGVTRFAIFTAASDAFTQKNINMTVEESLVAFRELLAMRPPNTWVRGYVSTAFQCPYAGKVQPERTIKVAQALIELGCGEISFGDTIGVAGPSEVKRLAKLVARELPSIEVFWHFHDTNGTALANLFAALDETPNAGFDASAGGLGGCPYAPGAAGNLATEDLVYALEREGIATGIDLAQLSLASASILSALGRAPSSKAQLAALSAAR